MRRQTDDKHKRNVQPASMASVESRIRSAYKHLEIRDTRVETDSEQANQDETRILASPILLKDKLRKAINYVADRALASLVEAEARGGASMLDRKNAALTVAICADKLLLLAGEPTARFAGEVAPSAETLALLAQRLGRAASLVLEAKAERLAPGTPGDTGMGTLDSSLDGPRLDA